MRPEVILPPSPDYALKIAHKFQAGWSQKYLITSDIHWDSPECYIRLLHQHLREAKEANALWIDNGDFFDVIGSANDPRGGKSAVIEEVNGGNYLDLLIDKAEEEFGEYADLLVYAGTGNHESKILSRKETDMTRRFVERMNARRSPELPKVYRAGYTGWIRFSFESEGGGKRSSLFMKLEHGQGGNAPVTRGVIQTNRRQVRTQGATFFVSGHIHSEFSVPIIVERPNLSTSRIEQHKSLHIQIGSYKADFRMDGAATWSMEKHGNPAPVGGAWLEFFCKGDSILWRYTPADVDYPNLQDYLRKPAKIRREA